MNHGDSVSSLIPHLTEVQTAVSLEHAERSVERPVRDGGFDHVLNQPRDSAKHVAS
jgi:hypothetical protein